MKKKVTKGVVILCVIILLVKIGLGYDLSEFPEPFITDGCLSVVFIAGNNTKDMETLHLLVNVLQEARLFNEISNECKENIGVVTSDSDIRDGLLKEKNAILVGGPCANQITAQIMGTTSSWPDCASEFDVEEGSIKVYNKYNNTQLIIAGYTAEDTRKATEVLVDYRLYNLNGKSVIVDETFKTKQKD